MNVQRVSLFGRISVGINLADVQHITARVEVVVGNPVTVRIKQMPTGIDPFQLVNKLILFFELKRKIGKLNSQVILLMIEADVTCITNASFAGLLAEKSVDIKRRGYNGTSRGVHVKHIG